ncbi:hypothetical protein C8R44DRAFT_823677 [Mycena epipterygia]|nr:hypothetical protein C8R44DRAFT_823677 [Mycena epipterygia]
MSSESSPLTGTVCRPRSGVQRVLHRRQHRDRCAYTHFTPHAAYPLTSFQDPVPLELAAVSSRSTVSFV